MTLKKTSLISKIKNFNFQCFTDKEIGSFSASLTTTPVIRNITRERNTSLGITYQPNYYIDSPKPIKNTLIKNKKVTMDFKVPKLHVVVKATLSYAKLHNRPRDSVIYIKNSLSVKTVVINGVYSSDIDIYLNDSLLKNICNVNHWISRNDCV